jgi:hypothetical protein
MSRKQNPSNSCGCSHKTILVSGLKTYKAGELADARTTEKIKSYEKRFNINKTDRADLYFFTVESMGAFGKEAINCVNSSLSWEMRVVIQ